MQRLALRSSHASDDQYVVPRNLELAVVSPATVNAMTFDHLRGQTSAGRRFASVSTTTTGGEANSAKRFLQSRIIVSRVCHDRTPGFRVVRRTVRAKLRRPQFTVDAAPRVERALGH